MDDSTNSLTDKDRGDALENSREMLSGLIRQAQGLASQSSPPVVQEIVLAQRNMEDARMRLGVALAYLKGLDPWANTIDGPDEPDQPDKAAGQDAPADESRDLGPIGDL